MNARPCYFRTIENPSGGKPVFSPWRPGVWHAWGVIDTVQDWREPPVAETDSSAIVEDCETGEIHNVYVGNVRFQPPTPETPK